MSLKGHSRQNLLAGIFLVAVLMGVYGISFNGLPSADDEQLFAAAAINAADTGALTAEQLFGNTRLKGIYGGIEPLHSLAASWMLRSGVFGGMGRLQGLFWLNAWYTGLTTVVLYGLCLYLGYTRRHAVWAGLALGLATPAWPYAKTFFREPLAMMLLSLALFSFLLSTDWRRRLFVRILYGLLFLGFSGGVVLTKVQLAALLPAFAALFWLRLQKAEVEPGEVWMQAGVLLAVFFLLTWAGGVLWPGEMPPRLTLDFMAERYRNLIILPHDSFWTALAGIFFSPGKGLLFYAPFLIVGFAQRGKQTGLGWFAVLAMISLALAQALAYDDNWWNLTWGTRFLLPVLPLLVLAGLPGLKWLQENASRPWRLITWGLFATSVMIQLGGVLLADPVFLTSLYAFSNRPVPELVLWDLRYAPWIGHWRMILQGAPLNLAAVRILSQGVTRMWGMVAGLLLILIGGAAGLLTLQPSVPGHKGWRLCLGLIAAGLTGTLVFGGQALRSDPAFAAQRLELTAVETCVASALKEGDEIIIAPYLYPVWYHAINGAGFGQPFYSWPVPGDDAAVETTLQRFDEITLDARRVWLIEERSVQGIPFPAGKQLQGRYLRVEKWSFLNTAGEKSLEVSLFEIR